MCRRCDKRQHDELLVKLMVMDKDESEWTRLSKATNAIRAIVELHDPLGGICRWCSCLDCDHMVSYPCKTIQIIRLEML